MPMFHTYIILSTRGCSPRRPAADMGTSLIFKVPPCTHGSSENCWTLCLDQNPFSPRRNSRASAAYAEKTTLPRARADVSGSIRVAASGTKPFSTWVLQGLYRVFATTTKICTTGGSSQVHTQSLLRHRCDLPTRSIIRATRASSD